jgi:UrcA family protein
MTRSKIILGIIAVAAVLPIMPVVAKQHSSDIQVSSPRVDPALRTTKVSYADLNLRNEAGVARLNSRIKFAVKQVCEPMDYGNLYELRPTRDCMQNSMNHAKADVAFAIAKVANGERTAALAPLQLTVRSR